MIVVTRLGEYEEEVGCRISMPDAARRARVVEVANGFGITKTLLSKTASYSTHKDLEDHHLSSRTLNSMFITMCLSDLDHLDVLLNVLG